jgi:hypothetical protein
MSVALASAVAFFIISSTAVAVVFRREIVNWLEDIKAQRSFETSTQCLGIVIPYRDRKAHLDELIPYLSNWFAKNKRGPRRVKVLIIEQQTGAPFNKGKLNNIGYMNLKDEVDYVCFHDVDYMPIRANYRDPLVGWTHLVSQGPEVVEDSRGVRITHNMKSFTGGVVAFAKQSFELVNGYSNSYWGWGYEDEDLRVRCALFRVPFKRRIGKYRLLPHLNNGFEMQMGRVEESDAHIRNKRLFETRFPQAGNGNEKAADIYRRLTEMIREDGLSTLTYSSLSRITLFSERPEFVAEILTVSI